MEGFVELWSRAWGFQVQAEDKSVLLVTFRSHSLQPSPDSP